MEEEQISPPESQAGEGVGGKGRGHRLEDGDAPDHYQRVYQVPAEGGEVPGRREVLGMPLPGHQVGGLAATSGADLNAVRTIQMIGTSVRNDMRHQGREDEYGPAKASHRAARPPCL